MKAASAIDISTNLRKLLNEIAASQEPLLFWARPGGVNRLQRAERKHW